MKVSILIPVYNVAPYIEKCLGSVMAQTYPGGMECILVDDGSTDDSIALAERAIAAYAGPVEFRIIPSPRKGVAAARNAALAEAKGEYVLYLDSDDALTPDCVEKLMAPMERDAAVEMVMGDYAFEAEGGLPPAKGEMLAEELITERRKIVAFSHWGNYLACWNKLIRRDFLLEHGVRFREGLVGEDNLWAFDLTRHLRRIYTLADVTYRYCVRPNSLVTGVPEAVRARSRGIIFETIAATLAQGDELHEAEAFVDRICKLLVMHPEIQAYDGAIRAFKDILRKRGERLRAAYLGTIHRLSRSKAGRLVLPGVWKLIGLIRFGRRGE